ncbi:hypothetical protein L2Y94_19730 [Luteibacter aegosomatis]|uniref:hypothetical protein n=1 Tax=Luteibacter aegosomatis TaxID=2911537 RepID=UPI001FF7890A|nr:hypothetical protein [Luteibacter aegosomatis]UPG85505.1 hypothetical protein L2Y94_19730 [Luteibacter aegosomatis]
MKLHAMLATAVTAVMLSGCMTALLPKASEPTSGPRARIRLIGGAGDLMIRPEKQPGDKRGDMVAHGLLWPGNRARIGMPDDEEPTRLADEHYVIADQDIDAFFSFRMDTPGNKYEPGTIQKCGPIDAKFHVDDGGDYEVSSRITNKECFIVVRRLLAVNGRIVTKMPVMLKPRFP